MDYLKIAKTIEFEAQNIRSYGLMGRRVAIIRHSDGEYTAIEAGCKHQGVDLLTGTIVDMVATCPCHQWQYDLLTGQCLNHDSAPLRKYSLRIEEGTIFISFLPVEND